MEEIGRPTYGPPSKNVLPDLHKLRLNPVPRGRIRLRLGLPGLFRGRKRTTVNLSARIDRLSPNQRAFLALRIEEELKEKEPREPVFEDRSLVAYIVSRCM